MTSRDGKLSVIIASVSGFPVIGECLESLHQQSDKVELEVIVANRCANGVGTVLFQKYPWIKLIEAPLETTVPQLRALAFRQTSPLYALNRQRFQAGTLCSHSLYLLW